MEDARRVAAIAAAVLGAMGLVAAGCMPDVEKETDDSPPRVHPVYDSETETIPLPNDVALDNLGTLPDLPGHEEESATGEFLRWLSRLHGWLPSTAIEIPFDGRLRAETVDSDSVRLFRLTGDESLEPVSIQSVTYEETSVTVSDGEGGEREVDGAQITVVPDERIEYAAEYATVVTKRIEDENGNAIVEPEPIFFAASEEPLVDQDGQKRIESLPNDRTARRLEELRKSLEPVFDGFAARAGPDLGRDDIAMAFRWSTVEDPQTRVEPETETLPLPNDAALDEDGTFPDSALDQVDASNAQGYLQRYLGRLHGWPPPPRTPISLPIAGDVKPGTINKGTVQVWKFEPGPDPSISKVPLKSVSYDESTGIVQIEPSSPLPKRTSFVAFATDNVEGPDGYSLKLPAAMKMALQPHPVVDGDESTVDRLTDEQARQIAQLQASLRPAVEALTSKTRLDVDDFGAFWRWTTWTDTFAVFDPGAGDIPFPNEVVRRGPQGRVSLPTEGLSGVERELVDELNRRYGFSTTAPGWIQFDGPLDRSTIDADTVPLLWAQGLPERYDPGRYELSYESDWDRLAVEPTVPLNRDPARQTTDDRSLNLGVVTKQLQGGNGHSVMPSPAFVFVRSPYRLYKDGSSTVDQLTDDQARQLEQLRQAFRQLWVPLTGIPGLDIGEREDVSLVYAFHPENPVQLMRGRRAQALRKVETRSNLGVRRACEGAGNCGSSPNEVRDPGSNYQGPDGEGPAVDMSNVARIQWAAEFDTVRFLQSDGTLSGFSGARREPVGLSVFLPETGSDCSAPFSVVVAQHGLGSHRVDSGMALANELAGECLAVVAADFPRHGGRAPGAGTLHPTSNPSSSGAGFFTTDLRRTKHTILQSAVDVAVLAELVQRDALERAVDADGSTDLFDYGQQAGVGYVGKSLGGFIGVPVAAVDDNVTVEVFNATGAGYADVLSDGSLGGDILSTLDDAGFADGSFDRFRALSFIQWIADPVDPLVFAPFLRETGDSSDPGQKGPLAELILDPSAGYTEGDTLPSNEVLVQMAQNPQVGDGDDAVVPNATTERLVRAAGVSVADSTFEAPHGFLFQTDDMGEGYEAGRCARRQAAAWIATGLDGEASFPDGLKPSNCSQN